jgi:hypothetical protein
MDIVFTVLGVTAVAAWTAAWLVIGVATIAAK